MSGRQGLQCSGHKRPVVDLAFSVVTPEGFFLASGSKDNEPMLRWGHTGDWIGTFQGHTVCKMDELLTSGGSLGSCNQFHRKASCDCFCRLQRVRSVFFFNGITTFSTTRFSLQKQALCCHYFLITTRKVWDAITGDEKHSFQHPHVVKSVDFSPVSCLG
jgi:serine-threonine kinase receptor-associated protein